MKIALVMNLIASTMGVQAMKLPCIKLCVPANIG